MNKLKNYLNSTGSSIFDYLIPFLLGILVVLLFIAFVLM